MTPDSDKTKPSGELALIDRIRQRVAGTGSHAAVKLGIGDDCAILQPPPGHEVLVTTDFCLEGRHFRRDWHSPESIGHRTLARGLSDLASMGATPWSAFLSLALPLSVANNQRWLDGFLDGLLALAKLFDVPLAGGDTSESPSDHVLADIVLLGSAPAGTAMRRSGARPGDLIYCTGALGGSATELASLVRDERPAHQSSDDHPHLFPSPRLVPGEELRKSGVVTACIDLSDGLSTDLAHLCQASGVRAEVDARRLPLHPLTHGLSREEALRRALHGGEDYELLFTVKASDTLPPKIAGVPLTMIGSISDAWEPAASNMTLISDDGDPQMLEAGGWEHFQ